MKLLRYGNPGNEKPGCLDNQGQIRDLSQHISDISSTTLSLDLLKRLQNIAIDTLPIIKNQRIGACVNQVGKFICIGLNYADHAQETGSEIPAEPIIFLKATSSIIGPYDPIVIPKGSTHTDWEVELGVVMAKTAKRISEADALNYIAGFCLITDVSERHYQRHNTTQWAKGKSCDTFGPIGPWLVTKDEIADPQQLNLWLEVNSKRYQDGNSRNMIFSVATIISYLSQYFTLYPGDIISTGTPAGVGGAQKPIPIFLQSGQKMKLGITGLGEQLHEILAEK